MPQGKTRRRLTERCQLIQTESLRYVQFPEAKLWSGFKLLCHCLINSQKVFASASPQFLESACTSNMKYLLSSVYFATFLAVSGAEHDHYHHADQMPLDYVKYPLEPLYRTSAGEGERHTSPTNPMGLIPSYSHG